MKDNKDIISESFFKKTSYAEKQQKKLPQYEPIEIDRKSGSPVGSSVTIPVTDTDELKKRLAGTYGVTFGKNSVKSMASKAIKTFPIIVSDRVQPETVLMLKRNMEDQYAEYINLLISNQVIDLSQYMTSTNDGDSNIAIQALDNISGTNFSRSRVADTAASGSLSTDDVFANTPLYKLLKEEKEPLKSGDALVDALLENALIVESKDTNKVIKYLEENATEITSLDEYNDDLRNNGRGNIDLRPAHPTMDTSDKNNVKLSRYMMDIENSQKDDLAKAQAYADRGFMNDIRRGSHGIDDDGNEVLTNISSADIVINKKRMDQAINRSIGEMLARPENYEIRDKFEKATFLLQSRRISGMEYYQYLTIRLGIPVSDDSRQTLVRNFRAADVIGDEYTVDKEGNPTFKLSDADQEAITHNRAIVADVVKKTMKQKIIDFFVYGPGIAITAGTGGLISGLATTKLVRLAKGIDKLPSAKNPDWTAFFTNFAGPSLVFAAVGGSVGAIASLIMFIKKKYEDKQNFNINSRKIEGWERVEALINAMDQYQAEIRLNTVDPGKAGTKNKILNQNPNAVYDRVAINTADTDRINDPAKLYNREKKFYDAYSHEKDFYNKTMKLAESYKYETPKYDELVKMINCSESIKYNAEKVWAEAYNNLANNHPELLESLSNPNSIELTEAEKKQLKLNDVGITPNYGARERLAYGSTEIERKENKDRRFNQPLIITVKFKERLSADRYSDNELTAVIGILGKVITVPTSEMEYILKENSNGSTVEGIFKDQDSLKNAVSDILAASKITNNIKNLPVSADVWANLEKVTTLAAANKITGRRNNNISNAHIIFDRKEIDDTKVETGVDYITDTKKVVSLMKRYSAFTLMIADDTTQRLYVFDDQDNISWNRVPYTALTDKGSGSNDQNLLALARLMQR